MTSNEVLLRVEKIFRKELGDESLQIERNSSVNTVGQWDSMNNLIIISAIEAEFGISFPIDIIFNAQNVGDLCDFILTKNQGQ